MMSNGPAKSKNRRTKSQSPANANPSQAEDQCAVVGIGASAGGLESYKKLLSHMPDDLGIAYVLIQHLDPDHDSMMAQLLGRYTKMPVTQVADDTAIERDQVYIIPPGKFVKISGNRLYLDKPVKQRGIRLPIDYFFRSLAQEREGMSVGVVLSGTGSDGTQGLREIKEKGGMIMVEDPTSSEHDGMPRSAIATGLVDFVAPIEEMPDLLAQYLKQPYVELGSGIQNMLDSAPEHFQSIIQHLRAKTDFDFRLYKQGTISRRIHRRMSLRQIDTIEKYLRYLRENANEASLLFKDLLISVTAFFREADAWEVLENTVIARILENKPEDAPIRIWVPGCATGEEAYSVAIKVFEQMRKQNRTRSLQIFGTDLDADAIEVARQGVYPDSISADVPQDCLKRYFAETQDGRLQVQKRLREPVVFAVQNLVADPPFSNLDLITCRNLMIYLQPDIQQKMLEVFHFSLRAGGYLFLGASESLGKSSHRFTTVNKQWRIFQKLGQTHRNAIEFLYNRQSGKEEKQGTSLSTNQLPEPDQSVPTEAVRRLVLERFSPAVVLVNRKCEVFYFHGPIRDFLTIPAGEPTRDLLSMCVEGLRSQLRTAIVKAFQRKEPVQVEARRVKRDDKLVCVEIVAEPATIRNRDDLCLVSFKVKDFPEGHPAKGAQEDEENEDHRHLEEDYAQLESELQTVREDLQSTVEELETSNEELKASNEEVMSMNEELQSTNEELETSREELQSLNEELSTVNSQLEDKVAQLEFTNNDLQNLLSSTEIATIFLDTEFCIRRFTPATADLLHIIGSDIGRPIQDLTLRFNDPDLYGEARSVLRTLHPVEREVCLQSQPEKTGHSEGSKPSSNGTPTRRWFMRRILPYRTTENKIDGVVITFNDITRLKASTQKLEQRERQTAVIAQLGRSALTNDSVEEVIEEAATLSIEALGVRFSKFLKLSEDRSSLRVVAGKGWKPGLVGKVKVDSGPHSQVGFTLQSNSPVIVQDYQKEKRFPASRLLKEHKILSGLSVMIGPVSHPWGVFSIQHDQPCDFSIDDTHFVQAIANLIWECIERARANEMLESQLAEIDNIFNLTPVGLAVLDCDRRYIRVNERLAAINGVPAAEHSGRTIKEVVPEIADEMDKLLKRVIETQQPVNGMEIKGVTAANPEEERSFMLSFKPLIQNSKCVAVSAVVQDLTELKDARLAIQESDRRLRLAKKAAGIAIHEYRVQTGELIWDQRMRDLWGYDEDLEITYDLFIKGLHPDDVPVTNKAVQAALAPDGDHKYYAEYRVINQKDGCTRWVAATGDVIFDEAKPIRLVGTVQDITRRRQMEAELKESNKRKDAFIASLSHELRNPLTPIQAGVDYLKLSDLEEKYQETLDTIQRQTTQLIYLVDDLLDVSRITQGKLNLKAKVHSIQESIRHGIETSQHYVEKKHQELEVRLPKNPVFVKGDPARISQIVCNLLHNSSKFSPEGSKITVKLAVKKHSSVELVIEDSGLGISEDQVPYIFELFGQISTSKNETPQGLGIGLSLVKLLVELHGGTVQCQSHGADKGSAFVVRLPLAKTESKPGNPKKPSKTLPQPPSPSGLSVLIVEDNKDARTVLAKISEMLGATVFTAANGKEGVAAAKEHHPDMILMDIGMPVMNGIEAAKAIRKTDWGKSIRLVAMTGWGQDSDKAASREAGFDEHIVKPPRKAQLQKLFQKLA